jgi:hypothetical protein
MALGQTKDKKHHAIAYARKHWQEPNLTTIDTSNAT